MYDVLTQTQRSHCMSHIRSRDTKPEVRLRKALWALGLRYRLGSRLPGKPDAVFPADRVALFVDGCFWHQCTKHAVKPKTNGTFWRSKLKANVDRDRRVNRELRALGWRVIRVWEHDIKSNTEDLALRLSSRIRRTGR
jgi:DNA mismatch endonuclease (patch repair protein)